MKQKTKYRSKSIIIPALCAAAFLVVHCIQFEFENPVDPRNAISLTINAGTGGTVSPNGQRDAAVGKPVRIEAYANSGYEFVDWQVTSGEAEIADRYSRFTTVTPRANAAVRANFWLTPFNPTIDYEQFNDTRDGKNYRTVKIGDLTWFAENLNYSNFGVCYNERPDNCSKYGRLYSWTEAMNISYQYENSEWGGSDTDHRGVCPAGWRLPNDDDWDNLIEYAGGNSSAGSKLKSQISWNNYQDIGSTDQFGFSGLPGGNGWRGSFSDLGLYGYWWSATENNTDNARNRDMSYDQNLVSRGRNSKASLFSVRCVQGALPIINDAYNLTINARTGGTVYPSGEQQNVAAGKPFHIEAYANNSDYEFVEWEVINGEAEIDDRYNQYTTVILSSNAEIRANFRRINTYIPPVLTFTAGTGGTVGITGQQDVSAGRIEFYIEAHANSGYEFVEWEVISGEAEISDRYNQYIAVVLSADAEVRANFRLILDPFDPFNPNVAYYSFTDTRDDQNYRAVIIGELTWFAQNLNYSGSGGDVGLCYDNSPDSCAKYGRLYDWAEAMNINSSYNRSQWIGNDADHQGLCPVGWRLPNDNDWDNLVEAIGGLSTAGTKLKALNGWYSNGTDDYGFSALPSGRRDLNVGFINVGNFGIWWSVTKAPEDVADFARYRSVSSGAASADWGGSNKRNRNSVRCVQGFAPHTLTITAGTGGTVNNTGHNIVPKGTPFEISASPDISYEFVNWEVTSGEAEIDDIYSQFTTVTLNSNAAVTANFRLRCRDWGGWSEKTPATCTATGEDIRTCVLGVDSTQTRVTAQLGIINGCHFNSTIGYDYFTDTRDGKTYHTVKIGELTWFAENLNFDGSGVCYENSPDSCAKYGRLYTWAEAMNISPFHNNSSWDGSDVDHQGACPVGWRLPNESDWDNLVEIAGGSNVAGTKLKSQNGGWYYNGNGTDEFGFSALPSDNFGISGLWWSAAEAAQNSASYAWIRQIVYDYDYSVRVSNHKTAQFPVRCVQGAITRALTTIAGEGGTVDQSAGQQTNTFNISAAPNSGYEFVNWGVVSGEVDFFNANDASTTVILYSDATVTANFRLRCSNWSSWVGTKSATCTEAGEETITCLIGSAADSVYIRETAINPDNHEWEDWDIAPATCTDKGDSTRVCKLNSEHTETKEIAQLSSFIDCGYGSFIDTRPGADNKDYKTVKIGGKTWLAENLNYAGSGGNVGVCYNNQPDSCAKYGRLYTWIEAMQIGSEYSNSIYGNANSGNHQGICPVGWRLPNDNDWDDLIRVAVPGHTSGSNSTAGSKLKSQTGWQSYSGISSTDEFGFSALPGGYRFTDGSFYNVGNWGSWWSATENGAGNARYRYMGWDNDNVGGSWNSKSGGYSVRCLRD